MSIAVLNLCNEITYILRREHCEVVIVSITKGSPCYEVTHILKRGDTKVDIVGITEGSPGDKINAPAKKGTWQKLPLQKEVHATR